MGILSLILFKPYQVFEGSIVVKFGKYISQKNSFFNLVSPYSDLDES